MSESGGKAETSEASASLRAAISSIRFASCSRLVLWLPASWRSALQGTNCTVNSAARDNATRKGLEPHIHHAPREQSEELQEASSMATNFAILAPNKLNLDRPRLGGSSQKGL